MGRTSDPKNKSVNEVMFTGYYNNLLESIANTWRITLEVVAQYQGISNFKVTKHTVWIQTQKYPENQWLQLR
jgi:activator of 2-hydroxyglutaryl-CoA dehydratase